MIARQHRDNYQRALNSQLIPGRRKFPATSRQVGNYTGQMKSRSRFLKPASCAWSRKNADAIARNGSCGGRGESLWQARAKQSVVLGLDRRVAFAGGLDETIQIRDLDV